MEHRGRVKLADVAARAGVSVATVSKVVNGRYGVAQSTIQAVQEVIDELGYVGNLGAAGLRNLRTNVLGVLVADFEPFSTELIKGAATVVRGTGYELLAHAGGNAHGWERRSIARLGGTLIDGAVLVTPTVLDAATDIPVVAVDPHYGPNRLPTVDADSYTGAVMATEHLLRLGHRRVAFLGGRPELDSARARESGFRAAMAAAGVEVDQELMRDSRYAPEIAAAETHSLLLLPDRPTAIFAANDITALRAMEVARDMGLDIPTDLSIIGFDDIPEAAAAQPGLTTIRQPLKLMGAAAMQMLLDLLNGVDRELHLRMPTTFVERGTCAQPPQLIVRARTVELAAD